MLILPLSRLLVMPLWIQIYVLDFVKLFRTAAFAP